MHYGRRESLARMFGRNYHQFFQETNYLNLDGMWFQHLSESKPPRSYDLNALQFFIGLFGEKGLCQQNQRLEDIRRSEKVM